jgi:hypothetical protein
MTALQFIAATRQQFGPKIRVASYVDAKTKWFRRGYDHNEIAIDARPIPAAYTKKGK